MDVKLDFVVKLGGSAITKKDQFETAKMDEIRVASKVLSKSWQLGKKFIIVHGAGSFGHHQAKKYSVKHGTKDRTKSTIDADTVKRGFCLTRLSVCSLNALVTKSLVEAGLPAVAQSACAAWETTRDHVVLSPCAEIAKLLEFGCVPVLHGDCVLDTDKGCTILSGDTICEVLCDYFKPLLAVFASDVAGIYNKPPVHDDAVLLPEITVSGDGTTSITAETETSANDVTGGIQFKLNSAINIVKKSVTTVVICDMNSSCFEQICLQNENFKVKSTIIKFGKRKIPDTTLEKNNKKMNGSM